MKYVWPHASFGQIFTFDLPLAFPFCVVLCELSWCPSPNESIKISNDKEKNCYRNDYFNACLSYLL